MSLSFVSMTHSFVHQSYTARIVFGAGTLARLPEEMQRLGLKRALVLSTSEQRGNAQDVCDLLGSIAAGAFAKAIMHVPMETVREAREAAKGLEVDCAVAIGGGSTTGLAKALALELSLPVIAIPTTYAGSEMTPIWGITEAGLKRTGRDPRVLPSIVIYDPQLSTALPLSLSVTSLFNAIAHAAEGLYAQDSNPITALMAEEGIRACVASIEALHRDPTNLGARGNALYGAWLCGSVLGVASMGLHHKLCHTLGGSFNLPHAEVHTVILPHALAYNAPFAVDALARMQRATGGTSTPQALFELAKRYGAPTSLASIGLLASDLDRAAELATATPYPNPRPLERGLLRALLQRAFDGTPPA
jgi:maleylacetate reductase